KLLEIRLIVLSQFRRANLENVVLLVRPGVVSEICRPGEDSGIGSMGVPNDVLAVHQMAALDRLGANLLVSDGIGNRQDRLRLDWRFGEVLLHRNVGALGCWVTTHCDEGVGRFCVRLGMVVSDFDVKSRGSAFDQRVDEALSQSGAEAKIVNGDMNGRFCSGYELGQLLSDRPRLTRIAPMSGVSQKGYRDVRARDDTDRRSRDMVTAHEAPRDQWPSVRTWIGPPTHRRPREPERKLAL